MVRKKINKRKPEPKKPVVDNYARALQMFGIVATVIIVVLDLLIDPKTSNVDIWIPAGMLGVAIGLSPETMANIIKNIFMGRK